MDDFEKDLDRASNNSAGRQIPKDLSIYFARTFFGGQAKRSMTQSREG